MPLNYMGRMGFCVSGHGLAYESFGVAHVLVYVAFNFPRTLYKFQHVTGTSVAGRSFWMTHLGFDTQQRSGPSTPPIPPNLDGYTLQLGLPSIIGLRLLPIEVRLFSPRTGLPIFHHPALAINLSGSAVSPASATGTLQKVNLNEWIANPLGPGSATAIPIYAEDIYRAIMGQLPRALEMVQGWRQADRINFPELWREIAQRRQQHPLLSPGSR